MMFLLYEYLCLPRLNYRFGGHEQLLFATTVRASNACWHSTSVHRSIFQVETPMSAIHPKSSSFFHESLFSFCMTNNMYAGVDTLSYTEWFRERDQLINKASDTDASSCIFKWNLSHVMHICIKIYCRNTIFLIMFARAVSLQ